MLLFTALQHSSTLWDSVDYVKEHAGFAGQYHNFVLTVLTVATIISAVKFRQFKICFSQGLRRGLTHVLNYA